MSHSFEINFVDSSSESHQKKRKAGKVTDAVLTPYEYTRLLQCRAKQISFGMELKVEWENKPYDPIAIAKYEIEQRVVPLLVVRKIPDASKVSGFREEVWNIKDMDIRDC